MTLADVIDQQRQESFTDPATTTDEDALGIAVSRHFDYDGTRICKAFARALEDANFHTESEMAERLVR